MDVTQLLSDVAEDLAIEILAEFEADDLVHLDHSVEKLMSVKKYLTEQNAHVPFSIAEVIRLYRTRAN